MKNQERPGKHQSTNKLLSQQQQTPRPKIHLTYTQSYHMNENYVDIGNENNEQAMQGEVVRYVQIPPSFPHFPRLSDLYESATNPNLPGIWGRNHTSIPILEQTKVRIIGQG